jgi:N-acetyl-anhydromuramyl-L-alanine amidase AmpD
MKMQIIEKFLSPNQYSNPNRLLGKIKGIVIHYYANPGSTALQNRNFFENRKFGKSSYGSAHYLIDDNQIIQAIADNKMAYHVGSNVYTSSALRNLSSYPNNCTIGLELAHPDWTGKPTSAVYQKTLDLVVHLCKKYNLTEKDVWTHKQVVGWKNCHKYYVENPTEWVRFIADVSKKLNGKETIISTPKDVNPYDLEFVEVLDLGDKGNAVKELQIALNKLGYNCGTPDGDFGKNTDLAVEMFQRANGLIVDGVVGAATRKKIEEKLKEKLEVKKPIIKEEDDKLELKPYMWDMMKAELKKRVDANELDSQWLDKVEKKQLTQSELAWLTFTMLSRHEETSTCCCKK